MKVSNAMSKDVEYVNTRTTVRDLSRLIFGRGINGVPVCYKKKVIGFIAERDILAKFYPSIKEYVDDPLHVSDFEEMEKKFPEIFRLTADKIMTKNPITVTPDTPLLHAQSLMAIHKVGRLPVVDSNGNLVGIISKGDIFRAAVGDKLGLTEDEEYNDWLSKRYYLTVDWKDRLSLELPDLIKVFKKNNVKRVLDIGCGTGEHSIELARYGFIVLGVDKSKLMTDAAQNKVKHLSEKTRKKLRFLCGDFSEICGELGEEKFDAAIFMGNTISHNPYNFGDLIQKTAQVLSKKGIMIFQITNFEKVFNVQERLLNFSFVTSDYEASPYKEHLFLEFYDHSRDRGKTVLKTFAIFDFDGEKWKFYGLRSALFAYVVKDRIEKALKVNGFKNISFYGSYFEGGKWDYIFRNPFNILKSDWLNIIAKRT